MNRTKTRAAIIGAIFAAASVCAALPAVAQDSHGAHGTAETAEMSDASQAYMDAMATMDAAMADMEMTGEPGADFALMMIPHHQSAIDMAEAYLASGDADPELAKLSQDIIAAQESEIAFLKAWLEKNGH